MKNLTKILAFALCLVFIFTACAETAETEVKETTAETTVSSAQTFSDETTRLSDNVPDADYNGEVFTFLTQPNDSNGYWGHFEFYAEEQTAVILNDAIYNRNAKIAERFNITFEEIKEGSWVTMMNNSINADEDAFDLVPLIINGAASAAVNGYLLDFSELEYVNLEQPWWDSALNTDFTINNKQYFAIGDLTLVDKEATYIMMFNKDVAIDFSVEDLYALVHDGKWTMNKFMEICSGITSDLNGDGTVDFTDRVGVVTDIGATYRAMYYACGARFFEKDSDDMPFYSVDMDRATAAIEKITQLCESQDTIIAEDLYTQGVSNPWSDEGINGMFKEGRALFYGISLTVMSKMRDMDSDFGVLPYPKLYETDTDYTSFVGSWLADTIAVPVTCSDPVRTSAIIEAMCCESKYSTLPAYYDVTITNKTMRDEESAEMLDYIFAHRTMDLSQIYDWGGLTAVLSAASAQTFSSVLAKLEKSINRNMDKTLEAFAD